MEWMREWQWATLKNGPSSGMNGGREQYPGGRHAAISKMFAKKGGVPKTIRGEALGLTGGVEQRGAGPDPVHKKGAQRQDGKNRLGLRSSNALRTKKPGGGQRDRKNHAIRMVLTWGGTSGRVENV